MIGVTIINPGRPTLIPYIPRFSGDVDAVNFGYYSKNTNYYEYLFNFDVIAGNNLRFELLPADASATTIISAFIIPVNSVSPVPPKAFSGIIAGGCMCLTLDAPVIGATNFNITIITI